MKPYYEDAHCKIYHGDCREILPELDAVDLVVTSPPYNLKNQWWGGGKNSIHPKMHKKFEDDWYDDDRPEDEYQAEQRSILELLLKKCAGAVCYNHKIRYAFKREGRAFHPMEWLIGLPLWIEMIWDRGSGVALNCGRPVVSDERVFVLGKPKVYNGTARDNSIFYIHPAAQGNGHPCPFPAELPGLMIRLFSGPGDTVLDPYLGGGTTMRAAKNLNRKCVGIERVEEFCEIAAKRLSQEVLQLGV